MIIRQKKRLDELKKLKKENLVTCCASLADGDSKADKNRIILKKLMNLLAKQLAISTLSPRKQSKTLQRIEGELMGWIHRGYSGSVVVFDDGNKSYTFQCPVMVGEVVKIDNHFHFDLIESFIQPQDLYYVVTLSQNGVKLLRADVNSLYPIRLSKRGVQSIFKELRIDEITPDIQTHSTGRGEEGFHGHGNVKDRHKKLIKKYFRSIDQKLSAAIDDQGKPIVLTGVGYLLPIFRSITKLKNPIIEDPQGNVDHTSLSQLHQLTWQKINPLAET